MKKIILFFAFIATFKGVSQNPNFVLFDHTNVPFTNDSITWVEIDTNNVKWVGTRNGLYRFYNNAWAVYTTSNSTLPDNRIDKFKIAYNNTIWFLNHNNGFIKFDGTNFTVYNTSNLPSLPTDSIAGIALDSNDVFMWTDYNGIIKFNSLTNSIYHIDTTNSCLQNIESLVYHNNHTFYGVCKNAEINVSSPYPQNKNDSIMYANDFTIVNTNTITINYCFKSMFNPCTYFKVLSDKFLNRYEIYQTTSGPFPQKMRKYNFDNVLIADEANSHTADIQRAISNYGEYYIFQNGSIELHVTINSPPFSAMYYGGNSIIPDPKITNFDIDIYNNVWLSTPKGLVVYNDQGVMTNIEEEKLNFIKIFPNPSADILNIEYEKEIKELIIYNQIGEKLMLKRTSKFIDLTDLSNGIYYLEVKKEDNNLIRQKIVISK